MINTKTYRTTNFGIVCPVYDMKKFPEKQKYYQTNVGMLLHLVKQSYLNIAKSYPKFARKLIQQYTIIRIKSVMKLMQQYTIIRTELSSM